jgi:uncharacterized OB-fold protein
MNTLQLGQPDVLSKTRVAAPLDLRLIYCAGCGRLCESHGRLCDCGDRAIRQRVSLFGEIYSYTIVYQGFNSFVLALVQLSDGSRVTAQIVDVRCELHIGTPVMFVSNTEASNSSSRRLQFTPRNANPRKPR